MTSLRKLGKYGQLDLELLGDSCLRETSDFFPKQTSIIHLFLRPASCASSFLCFFKPSCGSIEQPQKRCNKIHQVQNCRLSGCQSYASSSWKKKTKKRSAKKQHSLKARMRLYLFGLLRLDKWFSIRASDFLGILDIWKKGESKICSYCFLIMPSPTFAIGIFNRDMIEFQLTTQTLMPNVWYRNDSLQYLQHCNIVAWQMVGLLHPHETCCFLRRVVVIFCWYLVSEKKSTNNVRDVTNTMVYSETSYLLTCLPVFLHPQCYKIHNIQPKKKHQKTSVNIVETTQKIQVESQLMSPKSSNEPAGV